MPLLQANHLSYQFTNGETLFSGVSCNLTARRVGLIGRNGAGKSVLASILAKQCQPSEGYVVLNAKTQSFSQVPSKLISSDLTVVQYLQFEDVLEALKKVESGSCEVKWFDIIGDRWQLASELFALFTELGLANDLSLYCRELSGGQLSRLQLWKLFQSDAELLILDEPSNHLDSEAKEWLAKKMSQFSGHILLISHDRFFLRQMDQIWELSSLGLHQYGGNYELYIMQKSLQQGAIVRQLNTVQRDQKNLEQQTQLNREKADKRAAQGNKIRKQGGQPKILLNAMRSRATESASSRVKNEKGRSELLLQKKYLLHKRHEQLKEQKLYLQQGSTRKTSLVYALDCVLPYGSNQPISFECSPASKLHLQGSNGSGKSTLLKVLLGEQSQKHGEVRINTPLYYLDQHFSLLNSNLSLLDNLLYFCNRLQESDARTLLAGIGFRRDNVYRSASHLSGGEKMKLAMLVVSHQPDKPLLLLDEPDNHLDLNSKQILATALNCFEGAFILVSHDEEFVAQCAVTEVLAITT
ncbi:ATP-binding cassette domain-containing protein [Psychromonas antarctica]|uniref:ATP-binding cassette domain-containing protein n=1 Tax=Psychromonas antarctica TaxID=67573 RepID=UPI001EE838E1|nr:ATP-binding cassette domain-containing protein [Psychromonas antarctica]MCG6202192.1 ATP-binding cassette domain-containing protein [Psychromonas antarctica]